MGGLGGGLMKGIGGKLGSLFGSGNMIDGMRSDGMSYDLDLETNASD